jgi:HD-GYP domain-containing protein (c-di-GMP phosphodiesterase class II)
MARQLVWHPDRSPVVPLLAALPRAFEVHPLSAFAAVRRRAEDPEAVVLDTAADPMPEGAAAALPIIGMVAPGTGAAPPEGGPACYAYLPRDAPAFALARLLANAYEHGRLAREAAHTRRELEELNAIGVSLSAERDTDALLALILGKARAITNSDAGSIYLVEEPPDGPPRLRFKLAQNDFVDVPFVEFSMPISDESVAGYVARSGEILELDDAYAPPAGARYHINRSFDERTGYRTKSMLVVPMRTPTGETIGVLQLINCKRDGRRRFPSAEAIERETIPYPERFIGLAASLASQAAVALQNSRLLQSIQSLFEGFVAASVTAIESRDPTTSGHSFRVAELTCALAAAVDRADRPPFREVRFTPEQMKELRYASLLHDFGKVGVREEVLVKAKKLYPGQLELIRQRVELIRRGLQLGITQRKLDRLLREGPAAAAALADEDRELALLLQEVDEHFRAVVTANEPSVMAEETASKILHLAERAYPDPEGPPRTMITPEEARVLSIPRGSLTPEEYRQIQSHVVHTYQFLSQIPWTRELARVPEIARAHHEKLNGTGYPEAITAERIPIQSKMMTITDIFDALTASDRPYKAAVPLERALDILGFERKAGAIDADLLDLFIAVRAWERRS